MYLRTAIQILAICYTALSQRRDMTQTEGASGRDVVLATIARILQSGVFPDDERLLRRIAYVESRDGMDPDTFRDNYFGGIWQVDENVFLVTNNVSNTLLTGSGGVFEAILEKFRVDWRIVRWRDLRIPLLSALAARLFFDLSPTDIPGIGDVRSQGQFWKQTGFNTNSMDTVDIFVAAVTELELQECPNRGIELAFILDSSGSVGKSNFALERDLVSNVIQRFEIGNNATQIAVVSYSGFARINFQLDDFTTSEEVQQAIEEVEYFDISVGGRTSTNTADALLRLRTEVFVTSGGARSIDAGIPQVAVVITDGRSNINRDMTIPMALALRASGATVYSVGVGNNIDQYELRAIASSPDNVRLLQGFDLTEFDGLRSRITNDACTAIVLVAVEQILNIVIEEGDVAFFKVDLPVGGMTISLVRQEGSATLYASYDIQNPNSAFYDYQIKDEGEVFVDSEVEGGALQKREIIGVNITNITLFISLQGEGKRNVYQITTTYGNTVSSATGIHAYSCFTFILSFLLVSINQLFQR